MGPLWRHGINDGVGKVTVGIDDRGSFAGSDVVHGQVEKGGRFAAAGFANDVDMTLTLLARQRDAASQGGPCDDGRVFGLHRPGQLPVRDIRRQRAGMMDLRVCAVSPQIARRAACGGALPARYTGAVPES